MERLKNISPHLCICIMTLSLQAAITAAAHGRVGNEQFEQTHNKTQCSNLVTIAVNFPLQTT
jgi:hypothetical protein